MDYDQDEIEGLENTEKWIEWNNASKKKTKIEVPDWLTKEFKIKILYSSKFKKKDFLEVVISS